MYLTKTIVLLWSGLYLMLYVSGSAAHCTSDTAGLTIQALRKDTGEALWPVKWRLAGNGETYDLVESSATLDLSRMLASELLAGDYTLTAFSTQFAGSVNFTLPTKKTVIYVHLYRDVPAP